ncbi:polyprenol phosphomannose-dependent alpha 1,6 mannosyltransferase MptB [Actinomadura graeca]|uniref:Polyprenol phosphomannose-dependent alpha 1,6 mannosyltransferase MptB n=1 Tax=Actinomadura graeca TaxID=2750812 RepID=A0ABX8QW53_9ACTN|nr:polyprenol phosphomannose-dependent alpha 1,6 mannosyltransferase MptB [Actinomadura graeca]
MTRPGPGASRVGHKNPPNEEPAERAAPGRRAGTAGLYAIGAAVACFFTVAVLGPSAFVPTLAGDGGHPPYSLDAHPPPHLVIGLAAGGVLAGAAGLGLCLAAVARGWRVRPFPLVAAGLLAAVAFTFLPPSGSADHLNYASYGRMAATGHDPYVTRAVDLPGDPVAGSPEEWRFTPSVYGPIATGSQAFASWAGGGSVRLTVFVLSVINTLAFALTALVLYRTARSDGRRLRTALLWTCNPLLLFHLVSGAHNDVLAIAPIVAALAVFTGPSPGPRRALAAGMLAGAGAAIKLPAALAGGGPGWTLLRDAWTSRSPRAVAGLAALAGGAGAVVAVAYVLAGPHALDQVSQASNMVSLATPWHLVDVLLGRGEHRGVIKAGSMVLGVLLFVLLARALPKDEEDQRRIAAALILAWLLAAPYELPWYDGFGWALLALLPWTRFDWVLLAHTTALSLAYLPARAPARIGLPESLSWLVTVVRPTVIPWTLLAVLVVLAALCLRSGRAPATGRPPRASAGSPG